MGLPDSLKKLKPREHEKIKFMGLPDSLKKLKPREHDQSKTATEVKYQRRS
jgi:hypothetical protein